MSLSMYSLNLTSNLLYPYSPEADNKCPIIALESRPGLVFNRKTEEGKIIWVFSIAPTSIAKLFRTGSNRDPSSPLLQFPHIVLNLTPFCENWTVLFSPPVRY